MATQVQDILDAAYGKSHKNRPGTIASDGTELVGVVKRALFKYFAIIARANPWMIAESFTVSFAAGVWARPADVQSILFITITATGEEVNVVPFDDKTAEEALPSLYRLGRSFYSAGNANDPTNEDLDFTCAVFPDEPTGVTSVLDTLWPEEFNECLIHELAIYLATKDGRNDELPGLTAERDSWEEQLVKFCEHETANERRRFDLLNKFQTPSRRPNDEGTAR
jgi:hypothetical protein